MIVIEALIFVCCVMLIGLIKYFNARSVFKMNFGNEMSSPRKLFAYSFQFAFTWSVVALGIWRLLVIIIAGIRVIK